MALCVPQDAPRPPHPPSGTPSPAPQPHADTAPPPPPPPPPAPSSDRQPRDGPGSPQAAPQAAPQAQPPPRRQKVRTVFSQTQLLVLNERFERQRYLSLPQMRELSALLNLTYKQVKTWFQNRRMKSKRRLRSQSVLDAPGEAQMAAGPGDPGYPQAWTAAPPAPASLPPWAGYVWGGGQSWGPPPWSPQAWMGGGQAWSPAPQSLPDQPGPQIPPDVGLGDLEASVDVPEAGGYPCLDGPPGVSCFLDYDAQPGPL